MLDRKFILNADGFGLNISYNQAVLEGYVNGFLTSASLTSNTPAFDDAVNNVLPDCPNLSVGVHLNITTGKSLTDCPLLTDENGEFNAGFLYFMNNKNPELIGQIEQEFRVQIERILAHTRPVHIDSVANIHAIPHLFKIVAKLAKEYGINYIRTHQEEMYFVPKFTKHLNIKYPINFMKMLILNIYSKQNKITAAQAGLSTNDFILGIEYEDMMSGDTIDAGLQEINQNALVECVIHPCKYNNSAKDSHTKEFGIILDKNIEDKIKKIGFQITDFIKITNQ